MILVLKAKHGDYPVYARTPEESERAYLHLFQVMDKWGMYFNLDGDEPDWYNRAKTGDAKYAKILLEYRSDHGYEYEQIGHIYPETP